MSRSSSTNNAYTTRSSMSSLTTITGQADVLGGNVASVTSGAAVLLIAGNSDYWKRHEIEIRPSGGDIYLADDSGVGSSNGRLVKDGEVCTLNDYIGAVYAIALSATASVRYGFIYGV